MKGGYQILDLTGLDLEIKNEQTSISDPKILKQLDYLKSYIEDGYNFAKPLNNQLKPILLRIRDKKNGEKQESSVWANLSKKTNNLTFVVEAVVDSITFKMIQIEVVFELKQDEVDNYYYGIKTAKYLLTNAINGVSDPSIKPIYYHPISIYKTDVGAISFIIIDNSNEEYNTPAKLKSKISSFSRISPLSGGWYISALSKALIMGYAYTAGNKHNVMGVYNDGTVETGAANIALEDIIDNAESIADGVNKIN